MNGVPSHSLTPTHASICLGLLSSHVQNFVWRNKKFVLQFLYSIDHR